MCVCVCVCVYVCVCVCVWVCVCLCFTSLLMFLVTFFKLPFLIFLLQVTAFLSAQLVIFFPSHFNSSLSLSFLFPASVLLSFCFVRSPPLHLFHFFPCELIKIFLPFVYIISSLSNTFDEKVNITFSVIFYFWP